MKKIAVLLVVFSTLFAANASAQFQGTFGMGAHANFGVEQHNFGVGLHIHYYMTNSVRLVPSATFFLPPSAISFLPDNEELENNRAWKAELDIHVVAPLSFSTVVYPIIGASYTNLRLNDTPAENGTQHRFGGNFGVGIQHDIVYRLRVNFEIKYHMIPDRSQVGLMVGIGFWI